MRQTFAWLVVAVSVATTSPVPSPAQREPVIRQRVAPKPKASDVFFAGATNAERGELNSKNPAYIIARDIEIAGWLVKEPGWNAPEDFHFGIVLDANFITARYGGPSALTGAMLPGRGGAALIPKEVPFVGQTEDPVVPQSQRLRFDDVAPDGTSRGVTANSFILPGSVATFESELNAWWTTTWNMPTPTEADPNKTMRVPGRGPAPSRWWQDPGDARLFFPFNPRDPDGKGEALKEGDYVVLRGTLWQDGGHVAGWFCGNLGGLFCADQEQIACWNKGEIPPHPPAWPAARPVAPHGGWLEIHPTDTIYRAQPVGNPPKSARVVALCAPVEVFDATRLLDVELTPAQPRPAGYVLRFTELIDGRFTDMRTVDEHAVTLLADRLRVHVKVRSSGTASLQGKEGRFKAAYELWWEAPPPAPRQLTATVTPSEDIAAGTVSFSVTAADAQTGAPVAGTVKVNGVARGPTGVLLSGILCRRQVAGANQPVEIIQNTLIVSASGYADAEVNFSCLGT